MPNASIIGWGKCLPPAVLSNDDLATFLAIIRDASNDGDFTVALHRPDSRVWQAAASNPVEDEEQQ